MSAELCIGFLTPLLVPLLVSSLSTGGNSTQAQRITLLERVQGVLPAGDTLGMLGDREFIGRDWFVFLRKQGIEVCIRLKKDAQVDDLPIQACFLNMKLGELRVWREQAREVPFCSRHRAMKTYGVKLRILALCYASGEMLYLAYQGHPQAGLRRYAQCWQCENMYQQDGPIGATYPKTEPQRTWLPARGFWLIAT